MSDVVFEKGPIELDEIQAYLEDVKDSRTRDQFPRLMFHGELYIITDVYAKFEGRHRMITLDLQGRKKMFDVSDPLFFDGEHFNYQDEYVEMDWKQYYAYWTSLNNQRPDVVTWNDEPYIVYSFTRIIGEDKLYLVIGSEPNERITLVLDNNTIITRVSRWAHFRSTWTIEKAAQLMDARKWD